MVKVMVVDDEVDITETFVMYLEDLGYEAYGAKNSKEAFAILEKEKPNVLVLDINLREKYTGIDVLKKALELNPNTQAAMLTGLRDDGQKEESLDSGAKLSFKKPIVITQLKEIVEELAKNVKE